MKLITKIILAVLLVGNTLAIQSCANNSDEDVRTVAEENAQQVQNAIKSERVRKILYSVPSHVEMIRLVKGANIEFDRNIMNEPNLVANYNSVNSQAFNLGVYGTDLAYISIFEQTQEVLNYFSAIKTLADDLGVSNVINDKNIQRFERSIEDQDSLIVFISEIFYSIDETLNESDRGYVSAEVVTGGWIEAMHIMSQNSLKMEGANKEGLKKIISDQRHSLDNINELVRIYNNDGKLERLLKDLEELDALFDKLDIKKETTTVTKDEETGKVVIGGHDDIEFSDDLLIEIASQINSIRIQYVN